MVVSGLLWGGAGAERLKDFLYHQLGPLELQQWRGKPPGICQTSQLTLEQVKAGRHMEWVLQSLPRAWVWLLLPLGTRSFISAHKWTVQSSRPLQGADCAAKKGHIALSSVQMSVCCFPPPLVLVLRRPRCPSAGYSLPCMMSRVPGPVTTEGKGLRRCWAQ